MLYIKRVANEIPGILRRGSSWVSSSEVDVEDVVELSVGVEYPSSGVFGSVPFTYSS
jgi:hypothetical protein